MPKTYKYFVDSMGGMVLEGYNIVGDGTPQALLPILTGWSSLSLLLLLLLLLVVLVLVLMMTVPLCAVLCAASKTSRSSGPNFPCALPW